MCNKKIFKRFVLLLMLAIMLVLSVQVTAFADTNTDDMGLLVIGSDDGRTIIVDNDGKINTASGYGYSFTQTASSATLTLSDMQYGHYIDSKLTKPLEIKIEGTCLFNQYGAGSVITASGDLKITGSGKLIIQKYYQTGYEEGDYSSVKLSEEQKGTGILLRNPDKTCKLTLDGPNVQIQSVGQCIKVGDRYTVNVDGMNELKAYYGELNILSGSFDLYSSFGSPAITVFSEKGQLSALKLSDNLGAADENKIAGAFTAIYDTYRIQYRDIANKKWVSHLYIDKKYRKYVTGVELTNNRRYVRKDDDLQLTGRAVAVNGADDGVTFKLSGNTSENTFINKNGLLIAAQDEQASYLTVTVYSSFDSTKYKSYKIRVAKSSGRFDGVPYTGPDETEGAYEGINYGYLITAAAVLFISLFAVYKIYRNIRKKNNI